ncbi:hypothetical protein TNCV_4950441 [Trichonephila clavipes]|nr:hypothetical protein TNCV_4950441 [Trichonephila clavipes]
MLAECLGRHHTSVTTVFELWHRVKAAWASVPVHTIRYLFNSMPSCINAVITVRGGSGKIRILDGEIIEEFLKIFKGNHVSKS